MTDSTSTLLRLQQLSGHLSGGRVKAAHKPKSPEDIVIVVALRTPFTKAKKGGLKALHEEDMLATVFKAVIDRTGIDPAIVEDIRVGTALPPLCGQPLSRIAAIYAGFPYTTSVATVNRQCSSGLQACADVVAHLKSGFIDIGVAGGAESMTKYYGTQAPDTFSEKILSNKTARNCLIPMGITSENVATRFNISREDQDAFGLRSHQLAAKAQKAGLFDEEIVPTDDGSGNIIAKDDGIRGDTTLEALAKLKPSFKEGGSTTAGQSSQVTDGAGAALFMRRDRAEQLGLKPLARWLGFAVAGVPPEIMGIGPEVAIPKVLDQVGLTKDDIDIYEINEAFASQALHCVRKLGIPLEKVNPKGGAIAIGHPFGATGLRQIATALPELRRKKQKFMVASMCIGTGMGAAAVIENEML